MSAGILMDSIQTYISVFATSGSVVRQRDSANNLIGWQEFLMELTFGPLNIDHTSESVHVSH